MNPLLQCKPTVLRLFIAGVLAYLGLLPKALAVVPISKRSLAGEGLGNHR
jgi:hypothetical protein